jgi:hypothetical protein
MATPTHDVKTSGILADDKKYENVAEKAPSSEGDEANRVELDEKESRRILAKVDYRLVPILSLLYLVAFIDRSNSKYFVVLRLD